MAPASGVVASVRPSAAMRSLAIVELTDGRRFALPRRVADSGGLSAAIAILPGAVEELAEVQSRTAYELAFRRLSRLECSAAEVRRYLAERGFADECVTQTVERLQREGAIDDARAAESHVAVRGARGGRGQRLVRQELRQRGIGAGFAETATLELDDAANACALALTRAQRRAWPDAAAFERAVGPFLQRRGFDYETARQAMRAAWQALEGQREQTSVESAPPSLL